MKQSGFIHLLIPAVAFIALLIASGVIFYGRQYKSQLKDHQPDTEYQAVLADVSNLKVKAADFEKKGASVSGVVDKIPGVVGLVAGNQLTVAREQVASLSAELDKALADKLEADRLASEAAKKKAEEEAKKKAAEEAARKALLAQAQPTAAPNTQPATQPVVTQAAPGSGYARITVNTERGPFTIDVTTADVGSTRVISSAISTDNCDGGCGAAPLAEHVSRVGGYAGMNGTYFCPPDYANCAGKPYSFSWFVFNFVSKTFINADKRGWGNAGGLFVFRPGSVQFYRNPDGWGLDTSVTGAIASWPAVLVDGAPQDDPLQDEKQRTLKGTRTGICASGNIIRLVIARSATVNDLAYVFKALNCVNGINLDGGGSAAMWYGGYKVGPGRQVPNAIILAR